MFFMGHSVVRRNRQNCPSEHFSKGVIVPVCVLSSTYSYSIVHVDVCRSDDFSDTF